MDMMFGDEAIFEELSMFFDEDISMGINHVMENEEEVVTKKKNMKNGGGESSSSKSKKKKSVHRDIERQRRQEMATLCASLRSLLPLQYVKGKRAISDHMEQAVKYINNMKKEIEETKMQRNQLKKLVNAQTNMINDSVKVSLLKDNEMEVLITIDEECFHLSKVLAYLLGLGFNVTASLSTRANQHFFHKLHIQLNEITNIDVSKLEQRLISLIKAT